MNEREFEILMHDIHRIADSLEKISKSGVKVTTFKGIG
jgi:hypothetical protein